LPHPSFQNPIGAPFIELQSVDSTNNYALEQVYAGLAHHGASFFAHEQVAGKGQRGKTWMADKDSSLILSVVADPQPLLLSQQFQLSACVAVSVHEFFRDHAGEPARIKWPNDLYWHDRKAGGILIENVVRGQSTVSNRESPDNHREPGSQLWQWAVIGIGININQPEFPSGLEKAISLRQITGKKQDPMPLAKELCSILDKNFRLLCDRGFDEIYTRYQADLYKKDQPVRLKKGSRVFEATVKNVSPTGQLVVQHAIEEEFAHGEIEWLIT
jgi:BirA family transcriptional regulator, biotin operon repressor / biotin---[acetyl-CoA-carboxylase] ligase